MNYCSKSICVLATIIGLSIPSQVCARSIFDLLTTDLDVRFPFYQMQESNIHRIDTDATGDKVKVSVEIPGIDAKDLNITITDDELFIKGERKEEKIEAQNSGSKKVEKTCQSFRQNVQFPCRVDSDKAEAKLKNGILTVVVPKGPDGGKRGKTLTIQSE